MKHIDKKKTDGTMDSTGVQDWNKTSTTVEFGWTLSLGNDEHSLIKKTWILGHKANRDNRYNRQKLGEKMKLQQICRKYSTLYKGFWPVTPLSWDSIYPGRAWMGKERLAIFAQSPHSSKREIFCSRILKMIFTIIYYILCRWFRFAQLAKGKKSRP